MRTLDEMRKLVDTVRNDLKLPVTQPIIEAGARHLANDLDIALRALRAAVIKQTYTPSVWDEEPVVIDDKVVEGAMNLYIARAQGVDDE